MKLKVRGRQKKTENIEKEIERERQIEASEGFYLSVKPLTLVCPFYPPQLFFLFLFFSFLVYSEKHDF